MATPSISPIGKRKATLTTLLWDSSPSLLSTQDLLNDFLTAMSGERKKKKNHIMVTENPCLNKEELETT